VFCDRESGSSPPHMNTNSGPRSERVGERNQAGNNQLVLRVLRKMDRLAGQSIMFEIQSIEMDSLMTPSVRHEVPLTEASTCN
jgi:hypothetical protein